MAKSVILAADIINNGGVRGIALAMAATAKGSSSGGHRRQASASSRRNIESENSAGKDAHGVKSENSWPAGYERAAPGGRHGVISCISTWRAK